MILQKVILLEDYIIYNISHFVISRLTIFYNANIYFLDVTRKEEEEISIHAYLRKQT